MQIENFKLKDFLKQSPELINEYSVMLRYLPSKQTAKEVFHMKLKHVEFIKQNFFAENDDSLIEIVSKVQKISKDQVFELPIIEFFGIINSVKEQIEAISHAEEVQLTPSKPNLKWELVGGSEKMAKFGIYNTLESISNGNALDYKRVLNMKYSEVFTILFMRKTANELQEEMQNIKTK